MDDNKIEYIRIKKTSPTVTSIREGLQLKIDHSKPSNYKASK